MPQPNALPIQDPSQSNDQFATLNLAQNMVGTRPGTLSDTDNDSARLGVLPEGLEPVKELCRFVEAAQTEEEFAGAHAMRRHIINRLRGEALPQYVQYVSHAAHRSSLDHPVRTRVFHAMIMHDLDLLPAHCQFFDDNRGTHHNTGFNPSNLIGLAFRAAYISSYIHQDNRYYLRSAKVVRKALLSLSWEAIFGASSRGMGSLAYSSQVDELAFRHLKTHPEAAARKLEDGIVSQLKYNMYYGSRYDPNGLLSLQREYLEAQVPLGRIAEIIDYGVGVLASWQNGEAEESLLRVVKEFEKAQDLLETQELAEKLIWRGKHTSQLFE